MNPEDLPLKDIHLPDAISAWPPGPGWWFIATLMVAGAIGFLALRYWRKTAVRRAALAEFKQLEKSLSRTRDRHEFVCQVSTLLRRVAISAYGRTTAASAQGKDWVTLLRAGNPNLSPAGARLLTEAPYRPAATIDDDTFSEFRRFASGVLQEAV